MLASAPSPSAFHPSNSLREPDSTSTRPHQLSHQRPLGEISPRFQRKRSANSPPIIRNSFSSSSDPTPRSSSKQNITHKANSTVDTGTQYTPPDWPPTSSRSSLRAPPARSLSLNRTRTSAFTTSPTKSQHLKYSDKADDRATNPIPVPDTAVASGSVVTEPHLRVTPQTSLQHAASSHSSSTSGSAANPIVSAATRRYSQVSSSDGSVGFGSKSPSKRLRGGSEALKIMPKDFSQCDAKDLGFLIAELMMELIRVNDDIPLADGHLTRFHSRSPPAISVHDYMQRLTFHATLHPSILLAMVFLIDVICEKFTGFTINSLTVHRFLIAAATVCSKGLSDVFWTNQTYAKVGGVSLRELSLLEHELLVRVEWRIVPTPEKLGDYYINLVARSDGFELEDEAAGLVADVRESSETPSAKKSESPGMTGVKAPKVEHSDAAAEEG